MQKACLYPIFSIILFAVMPFACNRNIEHIYNDQNISDVYISGLPIGNAGPYLEGMQRSVKRLSSTSYYVTYVFHPGDRIRPGDLKKYSSIDQLAHQQFDNKTSSSGTAIVIHNKGDRIGLITTNHILSPPDTLYEYRDEESNILESITVKTRQLTWLLNISSAGSFEVLASDELSDLAVIGAQVDPEGLNGSVDKMFPVFPYGFGDPEEMEPGTFLYGLGYPRGYPMVTTGIVSITSYGRLNSFVTDILFNPGFSGGAVVAIRGGMPDFEWVGMARSTSASREWFVVPDEVQAEEHFPDLPYKQDLFIEQKNRIDYGITHVISALQIQKFLDDHEESLSERGYDIRF